MGRKKFFGEHLIEQGLIEDADVLEALTVQRAETATFERMVCDLGILDMSQAFKVLTLQAETDLSFMDVALRHEFIDDAQAKLAMACIHSEKPAVGEILVRIGKIDKETMERELAAFERSVQIYEDVRGLLEQIHLFKDLDEVALRSLANITSVQDFDAESSVINEGEPAENLYAVFSGSLIISKKDASEAHEPMYVGTIREKEVFGESAVFEGGRRTADVITTEKCMLLEIEGAEFQKFLNNYPAKGQPILLFLVNQLVEKLNCSNHELMQVRGELYREQGQNNR